MDAELYAKPSYMAALIGIIILALGLAIYAILTPGQLVCAFANVLHGTDYLHCLSNPIGNIVFRLGVLALSSATMVGLAAYIASALAKHDYKAAGMGIIILVLTLASALGLVTVTR